MASKIFFCLEFSIKYHSVCFHKPFPARYLYLSIPQPDAPLLKYIYKYAPIKNQQLQMCAAAGS